MSQRKHAEQFYHWELRKWELAVQRLPNTINDVMYYSIPCSNTMSLKPKAAIHYYVFLMEMTVAVDIVLYGSFLPKLNPSGGHNRAQNFNSEFSQKLRGGGDFLL